MPDAPSAADIATALRGRRSGARWMAFCPVHHGHSPALSIQERDGKVLVHCHAGCRAADVLAALRAAGLWPEKTTHTADERHAYGIARRRAESEAAECLAWWSTLVSDLEQGKADASDDPDPWTRFEPAARELARLTAAKPVDLLAEYRRRTVREPRVVTRLVARGRAARDACRAVAGMVLAHWRKETTRLDLAGTAAHNPIAGPDRTGALADPGGALPRPATRIPLGEGTDATSQRS